VGYENADKKCKIDFLALAHGFKIDAHNLFFEVYGCGCSGSSVVVV